MTVYTRAQWGSAYGPAGYQMGRAGEAYVHLRALATCRRSIDSAGPAAPMNDVLSNLDVQVRAVERMTFGTVGAQTLLVDDAYATTDVLCRGDRFKVVGTKTPWVSAEMIDDEPQWDRGDEKLVDQPVDHGVLAAAFDFDHAVTGGRGLACPVPAAVVSDGGADSDAFGQEVYAEHRITAPGLWSHAPGRDSGAGAPAFQDTTKYGLV